MPDDFIESIRANSIRIREGAEKLQVAIGLVEEALANLPGRVETGIQLDNFFLSFRKSGKNWNLYADNSLLTLSPLRHKIAAVKALPDLIYQMEMSQAELLESLEETAADFEAFMSEIRPFIKEKRARNSV